MYFGTMFTRCIVCLWLLLPLKCVVLFLIEPQLVIDCQLEILCQGRHFVLRVPSLLDVGHCPRDLALLLPLCLAASLAGLTLPASPLACRCSSHTTIICYVHPPCKDLSLV